MTLADDELANLTTALRDLESPAGCIPANAIPALSRIGETGLRLQIDVSASKRTGATVVIAMPGATARFAGLSPRQREVAALLNTGKSNKEIARLLNISLFTVKDHVHAILSKAGVRSRGEFAARFRA